MRHHSSSSLPLPGPAKGGDWRVIGTLLPYVWAYKGRVVVALLALVAAKLANVGVPVLMKSIVDALDPRTAALSVPLALLAAYGRPPPSPSCANTCSQRSRNGPCARSRSRCSGTCTRCRCASISPGRPAG
jgi:hypothetical protein